MTQEDPFGGLEGLLRQAQDLQDQLMAAREQAHEQVVEGHAGGGAVRVTVTGGMEFRAVHIDPSAVDPADVDMLEALVLAALHDAVAQVNALNREALGEVAGMAGLGTAGAGGLPGLETLGEARSGGEAPAGGAGEAPGEAPDDAPGGPAAG